MLQVAGIALISSILLSGAAIGSFSWSRAVAKWLMVCSNSAAILGVLEIVLANARTGAGNWAFLFACGAFGCGVVAVRNVNQGSTRWVHRFAIYAGYAATFAAMGTAGLWLHAQATTGKAAAATFIGIYVAGSVCVFLAKTMTSDLGQSPEKSD